MLDKRAVLLSKDEAIYNTDSLPVAGTNAILVEDVKWAFTGARMTERKPVRSSLAALSPVFAGTLISVSGKFELKGSGVAGTPPQSGALFRGAGFSETIVGGASVTYKPNSLQSQHKSQSQYFYDDGLLLKLTGSRGKLSFDLQTGKAGMGTFDFTGHFVSVTDAALPAATFDTTVPPMLVNVPFSIGGYAAIITKLAFDMGLEIAMPENIASADGYGEVQIAGRKVTGSFNPQRVTVATKNFISQWQSGAVMALDTGVIGSVAGNRLQVTMPGVVYTGVARANEKGVGTYDNKFQAAESAGDDEVSLVFT